MISCCLSCCTAAPPVYECGRTTIGRMPHPIPPLSTIRTFTKRWPIFPSRVIGVAMNSRQLSAQQAAAEREAVQQELGLPTCDVLRHGAEDLVRAVLDCRAQIQHAAAPQLPPGEYLRNSILHEFELPLRHTFTISRASFDVQPTLIVELRQNGHRGFGEATHQSVLRHYDRVAEGRTPALAVAAGRPATGRSPRDCGPTVLSCWATTSSPQWRARRSGPRSVGKTSGGSGLSLVGTGQPDDAPVEFHDRDRPPMRRDGRQAARNAGVAGL